ncbi:hypothetical protein BC567DRAFT_204991 [Phyllosticta citribraziliensis]
MGCHGYDGLVEEDKWSLPDSGPANGEQSARLVGSLSRKGEQKKTFTCWACTHAFVPFALKDRCQESDGAAGRAEAGAAKAFRRHGFVSAARGVRISRQQVPTCARRRWAGSWRHGFLFQIKVGGRRIPSSIQRYAVVNLRGMVEQACRRRIESMLLTDCQAMYRQWSEYHRSPPWPAKAIGDFGNARSHHAMPGAANQTPELGHGRTALPACVSPGGADDVGN